MQSLSLKISMLLISLVVVIFCSLLYGAVPLSLVALGDPQSVDSSIFWNLRVPRTLVVLITGALLALIGVVMQAIFRNDLCSPFTLGVAATAGLGVHIAVLLIPAALESVFLFPLGGWIGALFGTFITIVFALLISEPAKLLLVGLCLNFFAASFSVVLQYRAQPGELFLVHRLLMGSFQGATYPMVLYLVITTTLLACVSMYRSATLDLLLFGDEFTLSRGINPKKERLFLLVGVCLALSLSVACTGPITFIGLLTPHIARGIVGEMHKKLIPVSMIAGALLITVGDLLARIVVSPFELPPGIVTAMIGVPGFIVLLFFSGWRQKNL
jgi:iron complex transport system permease protein